MTPDQMLAGIKKFVATHDSNGVRGDCDCSTGLPLSDEKDRYGNCPQGYLVVCIHNARELATNGTTESVIELLRSRKGTCR